MNIAIDGPAGAGKSTIARKAAAKLGSVYVDTGAMYRAMALLVIREGIDPEDQEALEACAAKAEISIEYRDGEQHILLGAEDVGGLIRNEDVSRMASRISANAAVRRKLVSLQQELAKRTDVVMDGRDIGTVVLPDAEVKVYLTASSRIRAERRRKEYLDKGEEAPELSELIRDIEERDFRDMHREESPLKRAEDAVLIDSSFMTIEEVADAILSLVPGEEA
ncbi:MAG: (d)CMP kinase [Lachnospiraceae bacterium]|nr:(d)CMP kinase [Lachnospiraceae bacterium]